MRRAIGTPRWKLAAAPAVWLGGGLVPAHAHAIGTRLGDFYGGLLHPVLTLEHVFPLIALGLWAGQHGPAGGRRVLVTFPLALLAGAMVGVMGRAWPWMAEVNKVSFLVLGLLVAWARRWPTTVLVALAAVFGFSHGYGNSLGMEFQTAPPLFISGLLVAGVWMMALGSALTIVLSRRAEWLQVAVRVAGSWIAAVGIMIV